jgi:hypothetical protein
VICPRMPPPSQRSHKHVPKPDRRRALEIARHKFERRSWSCD